MSAKIPSEAVRADTEHICGYIQGVTRAAPQHAAEATVHECPAIIARMFTACAARFPCSIGDVANTSSRPYEQYSQQQSK